MDGKVIWESEFEGQTINECIGFDRGNGMR